MRRWRRQRSAAAAKEIKDLISDSVDCVIRGGEISDPSLVARLVGELPIKAYAAPHYLHRHRTPEHPKDLEQSHHRVVGFLSTRSGRVPFEGMQAVASVDEAVRIAVEQGSEELCVIGGGEVYALTLGRADVLHVTEVDTVVDGAHAFFPAFDPADWREVSREAHPVDAKHALAFDFVEYRRV